MPIMSTIAAYKFWLHTGREMAGIILQLGWHREADSMYIYPIPIVGISYYGFKCIL
jgi:hypothetical protein